MSFFSILSAKISCCLPRVPRRASESPVLPAATTPLFFENEEKKESRFKEDLLALSYLNDAKIDQYFKSNEMKVTEEKKSKIQQTKERRKLEKEQINAVQNYKQEHLKMLADQWGQEAKISQENAVFLSELFEKTRNLYECLKIIRVFVTHKDKPGFWKNLDIILSKSHQIATDESDTKVASRAVQVWNFVDTVLSAEGELFARLMKRINERDSLWGFEKASPIERVYLDACQAICKSKDNITGANPKNDISLSGNLVPKPSVVPGQKLPPFFTLKNWFEIKKIMKCELSNQVKKLSDVQCDDENKKMINRNLESFSLSDLVRYSEQTLLKTPFGYLQQVDMANKRSSDAEKYPFIKIFLGQGYFFEDDISKPDGRSVSALTYMLPSVTAISFLEEVRGFFWTLTSVFQSYFVMNKEQSKEMENAQSYALIVTSAAREKLRNNPDFWNAIIAFTYVRRARAGFPNPQPWEMDYLKHIIVHQKNTTGEIRF